MPVYSTTGNCPQNPFNETDVSDVCKHSIEMPVRPISGSGVIIQIKRVKQLTWLLSAFVLAVFFCLPAKADQSVRYVPSLVADIESIIEIGIERSGQQVVIFDTKYKENRSTKSINKTISKNIKISSIETTQTKTTNPEKRKTRPKPSTGINGFARAMGGDYSGLVKVGSEFADHIWEPSYNWDVKNVYYTKESRETTATSDFETSWENQEDFETKITTTFNTDVNKGFLKFSVGVRNIGERSVRIKNPEFVVHFVLPNGDLVYIGHARANFIPKIPISIASGQSRSFGLNLKDMNFFTLSEQYRNAIGVQISVQDLYVDIGANEIQSVAEILEELEDSHVRIDFFDGSVRSVRFYPVPKEGRNLDEFLEQALASKPHEFNKSVRASDYIDDLIIQIGSRKSDTRAFSALDNMQERYKWRRWFITVSDIDSDFFDAKRGDKIFPGYSIRIGFYGADQILPSDQYRPIVFERAKILIRPNQPVHIPIDLLPGDLIFFEDIEFEEISANQVEFNVVALGPAQVQAPSNSSAPRLRPIGPSYSSAQQIVRYGNLAYPQNQRPSKYKYRLVPKSTVVKSLSSDLIVQQVDESDGSLEPEVQDFLAWFTALQVINESFTHVDGIKDVLKEGSPYVSLNSSQIAPNQLLTTIKILRRPNESTEAFFNRKIIPEQQLFRFVVEENVSAEDSRWVFASLPHSVREVNIQSSESKLPSTLYGLVFVNKVQLVVVGRSLGPYLIPYSQPISDSGAALYNRIALSTQPDFSDFIEPYELPDVASSGSNLALAPNTGPQFTATIRVIRYN